MSDEIPKITWEEKVAQLEYQLAMTHQQIQKMVDTEAHRQVAVLTAERDWLRKLAMNMSLNDKDY